MANAGACVQTRKGLPPGHLCQDNGEAKGGGTRRCRLLLLYAFVTCHISVLVPVGTPGAYVGLFLGRPTAVRARDVLLALGLGAHLAPLVRGFLLRSRTESDASALDNGIYVVSAKLIAHIL